MGAPAVFLDRDGVVIENRSAYVRRWEDVKIFESALEALAELAGRPHRVFLVTNQSAVGRGLMKLQDAEAINDRLLAEIARRGGRIDGVYMCPHKPADGCACRKPLPGMILEAAGAHGLDLARSILIGDAVSDLQAARAAGIPVYALVRTGRGLEEEKRLGEMGFEGTSVFADLKAALGALLKLEN
jgi:histidinol-phosphate phosphatase family protein